jgi:hypothetical protein
MIADVAKRGTRLTNSPVTVKNPLIGTDMLTAVVATN